jgi:hypothetical protein
MLLKSDWSIRICCLYSLNSKVKVQLTDGIDGSPSFVMTSRLSLVELHANETACESLW